MDEIQKELIKAGRKDLAQQYYKKVALVDDRDYFKPFKVEAEIGRERMSLNVKFDDVSGGSDFSISIGNASGRGKAYYELKKEDIDSFKRSINAALDEMKNKIIEYGKAWDDASMKDFNERHWNK